MSQLPFLFTIPLGCAAAFTAMLVVIFPLTHSGIEPFWLMEALMGVAGAAAWMAAGLAVAQRHPVAAPIIFLPGAALAWFFARGVVHSVSPYYGLFSFMVACLAGAFVWWVLVRCADHRYARPVAIALPLVTAGLAVTWSLAQANLGVTRQLWDATRGSQRVHMIVAEPSQPGAFYLWTGGNHALVPRPDSTILLEPDPGSGRGSFRLTQVSNESEIRDVCNRLRVDARRRIEAEVADGTIPPFITLLPRRSARCESGRVWLAGS